MKVGYHGSGSSSDVFFGSATSSFGLNLTLEEKIATGTSQKKLLDRLEERSISYLRTDERAIRLIGIRFIGGRNGPLGLRRGLLSMLKIAIIEGEINVKGRIV